MQEITLAGINTKILWSSGKYIIGRVSEISGKYIQVTIGDGQLISHLTHKIYCQNDVNTDGNAVFLFKVREVFSENDIVIYITDYVRKLIFDYKKLDKDSLRVLEFLISHEDFCQYTNVLIPSVNNKLSNSLQYKLMYHLQEEFLSHNSKGYEFTNWLYQNWLEGKLEYITIVSHLYDMQQQSTTSIILSKIVDSMELFFDKSSDKYEKFVDNSLYPLTIKKFHSPIVKQNYGKKSYIDFDIAKTLFDWIKYELVPYCRTSASAVNVDSIRHSKDIPLNVVLEISEELLRKNEEKIKPQYYAFERRKGYSEPLEMAHRINGVICCQYHFPLDELYKRLKHSYSPDRIERRSFIYDNGGTEFPIYVLSFIKDIHNIEIMNKSNITIDIVPMEIREQYFKWVKNYDSLEAAQKWQIFHVDPMWEVPRLVHDPHPIFDNDDNLLSRYKFKFDEAVTIIWNKINLKTHYISPYGAIDGVWLYSFPLGSYGRYYYIVAESMVEEFLNLYKKNDISDEIPKSIEA